MIIKYVLKNNIYTHTRIERNKQSDKELVRALGFFSRMVIRKHNWYKSNKEITWLYQCHKRRKKKKKAMKSYNFLLLTKINRKKETDKKLRWE